jgi:hypothetical protein
LLPDTLQQDEKDELKKTVSFAAATLKPLG